jgi:hypothetical protein
MCAKRDFFEKTLYSYCLSQGLYDQLRIGNINSSAAEAKIAKKPDLLKSTNSAIPASL